MREGTTPVAKVPVREITDVANILVKTDTDAVANVTMSEGTGTVANASFREGIVIVVMYVERRCPFCS